MSHGSKWGVGGSWFRWAGVNTAELGAAGARVVVTTTFELKCDNLKEKLILRVCLPSALRVYKERIHETVLWSKITFFYPAQCSLQLSLL